MESFDPQLGLRLAAAEHLIPLFRIGDFDRSAAFYMAHAALDAYYPESRADYVNAARTIAFSMAAIALLGKAVSSPDLTPAEQMGAYARASALNRSADDSERSMMQRRKYHLANPQPEPPRQPNLRPRPAAKPAAEPEPEPEPDPETMTEIDARVAEVMQEYRTYRASRPVAPAAHATNAARAAHATNAAAAPGAASAIGKGPPATTLVRDGLLPGGTPRRAAMPNAVAPPGSG
jgi:hypothetical protein